MVSRRRSAVDLFFVEYRHPLNRMLSWMRPLLGVADGTENAAEMPMTDDTADAATTAVAADRGRRDCRETIFINSIYDSKDLCSVLVSCGPAAGAAKWIINGSEFYLDEPADAQRKIKSSISLPTSIWRQNCRCDTIE
eukprot:scaffold248_cov127-Skeletonema_dohrnii-CCMP3373.AAC.3